MDPKFSIDVAHAPFSAGRRASIIRMKRRLGERNGEVPGAVSFDIVEDVRREGCWSTVRKATLRGHTRQAQGATHHVVLSDDAIPSVGFLTQIEAAVRVRPNDVIGIINFKKKSAAAAIAAETHWITMRYGIYGIGWVIPSAWIMDFVDWSDRHFDRSYPHDDGRLALWNSRRGRRFWLTIPCLVEHGEPKESLMGHGMIRDRVASQYYPDVRGMEIDWANGVDRAISDDMSVGAVTRRSFQRCNGLCCASILPGRIP